MPNKLGQVALRTALLYAVAGALWILFSDRAVLALGTDLATLGRLQMYKGWAFVACTALLLYGLLRGQLRRWEKEVIARRNAEAEALRTAALLRSIAEGTTDAVFVKDAQGRYLLVNQAAARFVGRQVEEILGKTDGDLFDVAGVEQVRARDRRVMESGQVETGEETLVAAGVTRVYDVTKAPYRDSAGQIAGVIGISREITERKQTELALLASSERLALALDAARMGVWERNLQDDTIFWSPECFVIMGRTGFGGTIAAFRELVHPEDRERVAAATRQALTARQPLAEEFRIFRQDGEVRWVANYGRAIFDEAGRAVRIIGTVQDITERRELEARFRQAQKMEAIGQLAGGVAHDFNNILTVIQSYITLFGQGLVEREEAAREITVAVGRAASLSRQLLAFSRKQVLQLRDLDLNEVVTDMAKMLSRTLGDDMTLEVITAPDLPLVQADRGMMEQILLNLAVNARDAMPAGGRLEVTTGVVTVTDADTRAHADAIAGSAVCLRVSDNGSGIPAEILAHIFEPFFTTKGLNKGTGLGLATVHGIVKQHQGWVRLTSEVGRGTTFEILLPASPAARPAIEAPVPGRAPVGGRETVLLVDDEPSLRIVVRSILDHLGYRVIEAASGKLALDLIEREAPQIDVLLTDMVMPGGVNGKELATRLRERQPDLGVIIMSGYSVNLAGKALPEDEPSHFLQKPFTTEQLATTIRLCLERQSQDALDAKRAAC